MKKIKKVLMWLIGIMLLIMFSGMLSKNIVLAIIMAISGIMIIPPVNTQINKLITEKIAKGDEEKTKGYKLIKNIVVVILVLMSFGLMPEEANKIEQNISNTTNTTVSEELNTLNTINQKNNETTNEINQNVVDSAVAKTITETNGEFGKDLYLTSQKNTINDEEVIANNKLHQNGRIVYKWAIQTLSYGLQSLARKNCLSLDDIAYFLPHSANYRLLEAVCKELKIPMDKCLDSVRKYGNTSAASIPLAWYEGIRSNKIQLNDKLLLMGFGGGFTYGGICIKNQIPNL